ncbi:hypothetical protein FO519_002308 [Halicephalobus sp. NKZ332]|nr:hypothetical protein FO519_002308 [Halicephalobus sp. NKZ332]
MPLEGVPLSPKPEILTVDEIIRLTKIFANLGVDKVRVTGGEPTMRKELPEIIQGISSVQGIKQVGMTSNGIALSSKLDNLIEKGLNKLNISIDTLVEPKFEILARRPGFKQVWKTIDKAENLFNMLKLNCVVMRGINLDEVVEFVRLTQTRKLDIRFIEFMPFGGNDFAMNKFVPYKEILTFIRTEFGEIQKLEDEKNDTSKGFKIPGAKGKFGFITSMSEHFCGTCNRVCLHGNSEVSLRDAIREGRTDSEVEEVISRAVYKKKKQHAGIDQLMKLTNRPMILIGNPNRFIYLLRPFIPSLNFVSYYSSLTHVDEDGKASMVDISSKPESLRIALAQAKDFQVAPEIMKAIKGNNLKKGDVLAVARIAGIQAAKKTSDLIPLCHQISISEVQVKFHLNQIESSVIIFSRVKSRFYTGVEMEALTSCSVAALTIYDMCKAISHEMSVSDVKLLGKVGGKRNVGTIEIPDNLSLR